MRLYTRICKNSDCGKEFTTSKKNQTYCCPSCRTRTYVPPTICITTQSTTVDEVAKVAKEMGMSYGKYVAMKYKEERKKK